MSDGSESPPSPRSTPARDRKPRIIPGAVPCPDTEDSEGRDTPEIAPDYCPPRQPRGTGAAAARAGRSDQEAPATPRHYSQATHPARSQEDPVTMVDLACSACGSAEHTDLNCPNQTCGTCNNVGHHANNCSRSPTVVRESLGESSPHAGDRALERSPSQQDLEQQQRHAIAELQEAQHQAALLLQQEQGQQLEALRAQEGLGSEQRELLRQELETRQRQAVADQRQSDLQQLGALRGPGDQDPARLDQQQQQVQGPPRP